MPEMTSLDCESCKVVTFVKPNGECPFCGRLLTVFPAAHMDPATRHRKSPRSWPMQPNVLREKGLLP